MPGNTPKRTHIGTELRKARKDAGKTIYDVATHLNVEPSTVSRWETGERRLPDTRVMTAILRFINAEDDLFGDLVEMLQNPDESPWLGMGLRALDQQQRAVISVEASARNVRYWCPFYAPGPFQTSRYVRAIMTSAGMPQEEVDYQVALRRGRADAITRPDPPPAYVDALIWEPVLYEAIGGPDVQREQLAALLKWSQYPNVTIRIVPMSRGAHPGLAGAFTIAESRDEGQSTVHLETLRSGLFLDNAEDAYHYRDAFERLLDIAMCPDHSADVIANHLESPALGAGSNGHCPSPLTWPSED